MDNGRGFLGDLAPPIKKYTYRGRKQFLDTWEMELGRQQTDPDGDVSEWVLFTNVDERTFVQDFLDPSTPWNEIFWTSYDASLALLLVNMPISQTHEVAATNFHDLLLEAVEPMGLKHALRKLGGATCKGSSGQKNPDFSWGPSRLPRGRSKDWPAVILEGAFSEGPSKLMSDIRFWLHQSEGNVKNVLTLQINRQRPNITLEKWELQNGHPHRTQEITITKGKNQRVTLRNDPLLIQFADLFLRDPSIPRETDIMIDAEKLLVLADAIWLEQNF